MNLSEKILAMVHATSRVGSRAHAHPLPPLSEIKSVVVIRPDEIGDVVLTTPLLRELRRSLPTARIGFVVKPATFNIVEKCPYADGVYAAPLGLTFGGRSQWKQFLSLRRFAIDHLRGQYELAIYPRRDTDWYGGRMLTALCGARWRIGQGTDPRGLTHLAPPSESPHDAERTLDLLRWIGGSVESNLPELWTTPDDVNKIQLPDGPLLATCLAAGGARKIWLVERYAQVFRELIDKLGAKVVVVGAKADQPLAAQLVNSLGSHVIDLTGQTTLRETAEVLRRCQMYIGNDTGPMHIAAAVNVPVVGVFCDLIGGDPRAIYSPARFAPMGVPSRIVQPRVATPPCTISCVASEPHCIKSITVEDVLAAFWDLREGVERKSG